MKISSIIIPVAVLLMFAGACFLPDALAAARDQEFSMSSSPDTAASLALAIVKVAGALALVVGLMLVTMKIIRKLGMGRSDLSSGSLISILDTRMIAPKKYVAVLKVANELIAVGITDQQISLLSHLGSSPEVVSSEIPEDKLANGFSFPDFLDRAAGSIKNLKKRQN